MKFVKLSGVILGILLAPAMVNANEIVGSKWGFSGNSDAFVRLDKNDQISGFGGCNNFGGEYQLFDKDQIRIGPLRATRKGCSKEVMDFENIFLTSLESTYRWRITDTQLQLMDDSGEILLELEPRDPS